MTIEAEVCNDGNTPLAAYRVAHEVIAPDGSTVARATAWGKALLARERHTSAVKCDLQNPSLWDTENPNLYKVLTRVYLDDKLVDEYTTRTGIREIRLDPDQGLFVNGKHVKLKGFNNHHDHAGVGAAVPDGLQRYRIERLKWMGANAYRSSHNPMTQELLDVCDELGILVLEESRLMGINPYHLSVMQDMIRRNRNHPSIFLWSIANEEWGVEGEDRGTQITATMREYAHRADPTRPMSVASAGGPHILLTADVAGYNYIRQHPIDEHRANYPERIALGSEETTGTGTRGEYFPLDRNSGRMISHNLNPNARGGRGFAVERGWQFYNERPWLLGLFYWTGFDYRGEPNPMGYPATGSFFGVLDYCGFAKDEAYYLKSWWTDEPMVHIMPHWNLAGHEGETITAYVFSNCDEVELIVNGRKMGRKPMPQGGHLEWEVVYQPGRVEAVGYNNGKPAARERLETTGEAAGIVAQTHKYDDGLYVIDVAVNDSKGRFVPTASLPLTVSVDGNARILGYGNGDSAFTGVERPLDRNARLFDIETFNGLAQILIQSPDGEFNLTVGSNRLQPKTIALRSSMGPRNLVEPSFKELRPLR
jgi:beta-galactosidase